MKRYKKDDTKVTGLKGNHIQNNLLLSEYYPYDSIHLSHRFF